MVFHEGLVHHRRQTDSLHSIWLPAWSFWRLLILFAFAVLGPGGQVQSKHLQYCRTRLLPAEAADAAGLTPDPPQVSLDAYTKLTWKDLAAVVTGGLPSKGLPAGQDSLGSSVASTRRSDAGAMQSSLPLALSDLTFKGVVSSAHMSKTARVAQCLAQEQRAFCAFQGWALTARLHDSAFWPVTDAPMQRADSKPSHVYAGRWALDII